MERVGEGHHLHRLCVPRRTTHRKGIMDRRRIVTLLAAAALLAGACSADVGAVDEPRGRRARRQVLGRARRQFRPDRGVRPTTHRRHHRRPPPPEYLQTVARRSSWHRSPDRGRDGAPGLSGSDGRPAQRPSYGAAGSVAPDPAPKHARARRYDVLRSTIATVTGRHGVRVPGDTFREFRLDATTADFLGSKGLLRTVLVDQRRVLRWALAVGRRWTAAVVIERPARAADEAW